MSLFGFDPFDLKKLAQLRDNLTLSKALKRPEAAPRKGLFALFGNTVNKKQQRVFNINAEMLGRLAKNDPVTWTIIRTVKAFVNQAAWDIEIDTEQTEQELDRWEEYALSHLSPYAIGELEDFKSEHIDDKLEVEISSRLKAILKEPTDMSEKKKSIQWYFASVIRKIHSDAEAHRWPVKQIFEIPSERGAESNFRRLQELVLNDILVYDAGCVVKNWNRGGDLAELYHIPGKDVRIFRNPDRTFPEPPEPAYVWEEGGIQRALYSKEELVYIMQNPQDTGYGFSPLECAIYVITASIFADEYNLDFFKNSNVPPGVFDLGKDVTAEQREGFQMMWENEVRGRGGLHRMLFTSGSENPKFIPIRNMTNRDMQMMDYLKWTMGIKTACFGLSPQDIGFMTETKGLGGGGVAQTQQGLSHARGIRTILTLLESSYNSDIVKKEFKFTDVKFVWKDIDVADEQKEATIDKQDIDAGVMSRNDRRKKLGMKPAQGGDVLTVTMAGQLVPISELEKYEEGREDIEEQAANAEGGAPQDLSQTPQPGSPTAQEVQGQPGQPTQEPSAVKEPIEQMQKTPERINVKVNRRIPVKKQYDFLHSVVKELQNKGVEATLKIGFGDE